MKFSLRKTPSALQFVYKYDGAAGQLTGSQMTLSREGSLLTLTVDLSANLRTRDHRVGGAWQDAMILARDRHKLKFVQCHDRLMRTRLVKAWEQVDSPRMRLALLMGPALTCLYEVKPRALLLGGVQLDVVDNLDPRDLETTTVRAWRSSGFRASGFRHSQAGA